MKPAKKEDIPPEVVQEIEAQLNAMCPGMEVRFMGDEDEVPPRIVSEMDQLEASMRDSIFNGTCIDCGAKIPGDWPPNEGPLPKGWAFYSEDDTPIFLTCPDCDKDA